MALVEWRPIAGYEGIYEASSAGDIRRVAPGRRTRPGHVLQTKALPKKYRIIKLYRDGVPRSFSVHSLIAATFIGPCPPGGEVNHKNGIKSDNAVTNLEHTTRQGNAQHAAAAGLYCEGEEVHNAKLTADDVRALRALATCRWSQRKLAVAFGISKTTVAQIISRKWWKGV